MNFLQNRWVMWGGAGRLWPADDADACHQEGKAIRLQAAHRRAGRGDLWTAASSGQSGAHRFIVFLVRGGGRYWLDGLANAANALNRDLCNR